MIVSYCVDDFIYPYGNIFLYHSIAGNKNTGCFVGTTTLLLSVDCKFLMAYFFLSVWMVFFLISVVDLPMDTCGCHDKRILGNFQNCGVS